MWIVCLAFLSLKNSTTIFLHTLRVSFRIVGYNILLSFELTRAEGPAGGYKRQWLLVGVDVDVDDVNADLGIGVNIFKWYL